MPENNDLESLQASLDDLTMRYQALMGGTSVGLWDWDMRKGELINSKRMQELSLFVTGEENPTFEEIFQHVHPGDIDKIEEAITEHLGEQKPFDLEYRAITPNNETRWMRLRGEIVQSDAQGPIRSVGSSEDITDQKLTESRLFKAAEFQELVFSKIDDMVFVKDEDFRFVLANPAFLNVYPEERRDEVIGFTTVEEFDEQQRQLFLAEDQRALDEGYTETQETIDCPDGIRRTLWTRKSRFEDAEGNAFVLAVARDVTGDERTRKALETANQELEEFSYRISHDLRSPLVSSLKLLELLADVVDQEDPAASKRLLSTATDSLKRLNGLANDILDIARIRQGEIAGEVIDIESLTAHIWEDLHAQAEANAVRLEAAFHLGADLVGDRYGLNLLLANLLSNAVKYADKNTSDAWVQVSANVNPRVVRISVTDNGIGIPAEYRSQLFGMFKRFHPSHASGSGLGLYMVAKWAERLGGSIEAEHLPQGTRFNIELPQLVTGTPC